MGAWTLVKKDTEGECTFSLMRDPEGRYADAWFCDDADGSLLGAVDARGQGFEPAEGVGMMRAGTLGAILAFMARVSGDGTAS